MEQAPGLVVMGGESCTGCCEFNSLHRILNGLFLHIICCKNGVMFAKTKTDKRGKDGTFYKYIKGVGILVAR